LLAQAGELRFHVHDDKIGRGLVKRGARPEFSTLARAVELTGASGLFLDVGANIGTTCIAAVRLHRFERAVALEPHPDNCLLLRRNALLNDVEVDVVEAAASSRAGVESLSIHPTNSGGHKLGPVGARRTIPVRTTTLDSLALEPGLIWIDVQGGEGRVLEGARETLRSRPPIVLELYPRKLGEGLETIREVARDYRVVDLRGGTRDFDQIVRDVGHTLTDVLLH
jgi:FkbM family methyltransferase